MASLDGRGPRWYEGVRGDSRSADGWCLLGGAAMLLMHRRPASSSGSAELRLAHIRAACTGLLASEARRARGGLLALVRKRSLAAAREASYG